MNRINLSRLVILAFAGLMLSVFTDYLYSATPTTINYQGRLRESGQPVTNPAQTLEFRIYDDPSAGALIWRSGDVSVAVNVGIFSYAIGSNDGGTSPNKFSVIDWTAPTGAGSYWLEISVGGASGTTLSPREQLQASAYAFYASSAAYAARIKPDAINGLVKCNGSGTYSAIADNSANWNSAYTEAVTNATDSNTINTIVKRNGSGNFSAGTITATMGSGSTWNGNAIGVAYGGTGSAYFTVSGPASTAKTYTFPNATCTVLTTNAVVTGAQGGTGSAYFTVAGPTVARTYTFPDAATTIVGTTTTQTLTNKTMTDTSNIVYATYAP